MVPSKTHYKTHLKTYFCIPFEIGALYGGRPSQPPLAFPEESEPQAQFVSQSHPWRVQSHFRTPPQSFPQSPPRYEDTSSVDTSSVTSESRSRTGLCCCFNTVLDFFTVTFLFVLFLPLGAITRRRWCLACLAGARGGRVVELEMLRAFMDDCAPVLLANSRPVPV